MNYVGAGGLPSDPASSEARQLAMVREETVRLRALGKPLPPLRDYTPSRTYADWLVNQERISRERALANRRLVIRCLLESAFWLTGITLTLRLFRNEDFVTAVSVDLMGLVFLIRQRVIALIGSPRPPRKDRPLEESQSAPQFHPQERLANK
ncbi:hypothetical protein ACX9I7_22230 [Streptomyces sp. L500]|uniref:hypothetical protein n=1 Tax=Streptomyces abikoensis TaxID=97398 RepID=UPI0033E81238